MNQKRLARAAEARFNASIQRVTQTDIDFAPVIIDELTEAFSAKYGAEAAASPDCIDALIRQYQRVVDIYSQSTAELNSSMDFSYDEAYQVILDTMKAPKHNRPDPNTVEGRVDRNIKETLRLVEEEIFMILNEERNSRTMPKGSNVKTTFILYDDGSTNFDKGVSTAFKDEKAIDASEVNSKDELFDHYLKQMKAVAEEDAIELRQYKHIHEN